MGWVSGLGGNVLGLKEVHGWGGGGGISGKQASLRIDEMNEK